MPSVAPETFAERLVRLMQERSMTVERLHEELNGAVSPRTLWRWRSGATAPGIEALPLLSRALAVTPNDLVGWTDSEDR